MRGWDFSLTSEGPSKRQGLKGHSETFENKTVVTQVTADGGNISKACLDPQLEPSWQPSVVSLCLQQPRQLGAGTWEPCDSESDIWKWVKNRALVARRGWEGEEQSLHCCGETLRPAGGWAGRKWWREYAPF